MKKTYIFIYLFLALSVLVGCAPRFPELDSYYVSPFELTHDEVLLGAGKALSPDGESMAVALNGSLDLVSLRTGERTDIAERTGVWDLSYSNKDVTENFLTWSTDGRYLGIRANHYESTSVSAVSQAFYVLDMMENTATRYDLWASEFSPFDANHVYAKKGVYNLIDGTTIPFSSDFDFGQEKNFRSTAPGVLWSKSLGVPVAGFGTLPLGTSVDADREVIIESFNPTDPGNSKYSIPIGFTLKKPNQGVGLLFDPTGEYVLIVEWQCSQADQKQCSLAPELSTNGVQDTVLTLVHWRTKKQQELIRLSAIDPENVVAYGYMAWSADGSTIFISRKDASPIVLKLK